MIKASSSKEIDALVADLASDAAITRDGAIARLTVIGARAVDRLLSLASQKTAAPFTRVAAFRSLEGIAEARALPSALAAFAEPDPTIAIAALNVARVFLSTPHGIQALDQVTSVALDRARPAAVRIAAIQALSDLSADTVKPVLQTLKADSDPEIVNALAPPRQRGAINPTERLENAAKGVFPADAAALRSAFARAASDVPVSTLHQIVEQVRVHEGSEPAERRNEWMAVRAAAHLALAQRGSRLALYDLRETIESARQPIAVEFLATLATIGDVSCLEPLAGAYAHATAAVSPDVWWRQHLAETFRAIVAREHITRRHGTVKKIAKRWKAALDELWAGAAG